MQLDFANCPFFGLKFLLCHLKILQPNYITLEGLKEFLDPLKTDRIKKYFLKFLSTEACSFTPCVCRQDNTFCANNHQDSFHGCLGH